MRKVEIKFEERGKVFFDSAIIRKDITEIQALQLVANGDAEIVEVEDGET